MITFGLGMMGCAVLLMMTWIEPRIGWAGRGVAASVALFFAYIGVGFVLSAWASWRSPVFTIYPDRFVAHDVLGDYEVKPAEIARQTWDTRRGHPAYVIELFDGRRVIIPESLKDARKAVEVIEAWKCQEDE